MSRWGRPREILGIVVAGYLSLILAAHLWSRAGVVHEPCPGGGAVILVDSNARVMCLCRNGRAEAVFRVALGRGGLDKRAEGDGRTPSGPYRLGSPRRSTRYHVFIPVDYPTAEQRRAGYSGSDVGIHGPHLAFALLRHATVWPDWTRGCIAVGTRAEIEQVAAWVRRYSPMEIAVV